MSIFRQPAIVHGLIDSYTEPIAPPDSGIDPRHLPNFSSLLYQPRMLEVLPEQQWGEVTRSMFRLAQADRYVIRPNWRGQPRQHVYVPEDFAPYLRIADHVAAEVVPVRKHMDVRVPSDIGDCLGVIRRLINLNGEPFHTSRWRRKIYMPTAEERPFWLPEAEIGDDIDVGPSPFNGPYSRLLQITKNGIQGGVRALMIAPAGAGKTEYFKHLVQEVRGRRNLHLVLCLVERPHEVRSIMRQIRLEPGNVHVFAAVDTQSELRRFHTVELAFLRALRLLEKGTPEDPVEVVMLFDGFSNGVEDPINTMGATEGGKLAGSMSRWTASLARILFTTAGRTAGATFTLVATVVDNAADSTQALLNEIIPRANTHISLSGELARKRIFPALNTEYIRAHNQGKESFWPASSARLEFSIYVAQMTWLAELISPNFWLPAAKTKLVEEDQERRNEKLKAEWEAERVANSIREAAAQSQQALEAQQASDARIAKAEAQGTGRLARRRARERDAEDGVVAAPPQRPDRGDSRSGRGQKEEGPPRDGRMIMPDKDPVRDRAIQMAGYHLRRLMKMLENHDSDRYIFEEFDVLNGQVSALQRLDLLIERGAFNERGEANLTSSDEATVSPDSSLEAVAAITNNAPLAPEVVAAVMSETIPMVATISAPPADPIAEIFDSEAATPDQPAVLPHPFLPQIAEGDPARDDERWGKAVEEAQVELDDDIERIFDQLAEVAGEPALAESAELMLAEEIAVAEAPPQALPDPDTQLLDWLVVKHTATITTEQPKSGPPRPFSWDLRARNGMMKEVEWLLRLPK